MKTKGMAILLALLCVAAGVAAWQPGPHQSDRVYFDTTWDGTKIYVISGSDSTTVEGGRVTTVTVVSDTITIGEIIAQLVTRTDTLTAYGDAQITVGEDIVIAGNDLWITDATGADSVRIYDSGSQTIIKSDNRIDVKGEGGSGNFQLGNSYINVQVLFKPVANNAILCGRADARWSHMYANIVAVGDSSAGDYDGWIYASDDGDVTAHKFGWDDGLDAWYADNDLVLFSTYTAELRDDGTDAEVTYLVLYNADGEKCYIYPNVSQDGIVVSNTKP